MRITRKMLDAKLAYVAQMTGHAGYPWHHALNGAVRANVGVWFFDYNPLYGGYALCEMVNTSGGETTIWGRCSAAEMYAFLRGMSMGLHEGLALGRAY